MSAPILYTSADGSAPTLSGTAGDLVNLLDKVLVSGYGSQSAAGWVRKTAFAGNASTRAVFQQGAGNQFFLDVDDRGASGGLTTPTGKEAAVRGYEAMTDVSTGTAPFPTVAQIAAATGNWRKSATADATTRGWFVIADDRSFVLGILDADVASVYKVYCFGDFYSLTTADGFRTMISVRTVVNSAAITGLLGGAFVVSLATAMAGFYTVRIAAGSGASVSNALLSLGTTFPVTSPFPAPDGGIYLSRLLIADTGTSTLRGWMRGVYLIVNPVGLADGDTFGGSGDFAGRTFRVVKGVGALAACMAIETSTWDTSS